jgi:small subunit ribosomal protein S13
MIIYEKNFKIEKSFVNQLNSVYGISSHRASNVCAILGLKKHSSIDKMLLTVKDDLNVLIKDIIDKDKKYFVENSLKHQNILKRKDLKLLNNYKSLRFNQGLPVNGQRTHTNAKTQKKKRK